MPKVKQKESSKLALIVQKYPIFKTDGKIIYCKVCEKQVSADKIFSIKQHINGATHKALEANASKSLANQQFIGENTNASKSIQFSRELSKALVAADIPLYKMRNKNFASIFQKYLGFNIPSEATLRRNVNYIYTETMEKIRSEVGNNYIWISIDETIDAVGRYIGNVIIGILDPNLESPKKMLLNTVVLEKANHSTIARLFDDSVKLLGENFNKSKILLFVSDAAPYMKKAGKTVKVFYPNVTHLTCLAHALHRVCEKIRDVFPKIDELIANVKRVFNKAPSRISKFKEMEPDVPQPPQPITTRWGTWLEAVHYYVTHFEKVKKIVDSFNCEYSRTIKISQELFAANDVKQQLIFIDANYYFLTLSIQKLEKSGLELSEQVSIVNSAKEAIYKSKSLEIIEKFNSVLKDNGGYEIIQNIEKIISSEKGNLILIWIYI